MGVIGRLGRPDFFNPALVPRGAFELDRTHPLARGLIAAWIPGSIYKWRNLVGVPYSEVPTGIKYAGGPRGGVADFSGISASGGVSTTFTTALTDLTLETSFYIPASPNSWARIVDKKYDTGLLFGRIGATGDWGGGIKQYSYPSGDGLTLSSSAWHQLVMSRSGSTKVVAADGDATTGSWTVDATAIDTTAMKIGYNSGDHESFTGLMERLLIYNRALSADERVWLYRESYAMFRPVVRRIWSTPSGGPTNITLTQQAVMSTGNVPTVNQKQQITGTKQAVTWTGNIPTSNQKQAITATQRSVTWTGNVPAINQKQAITATQASWQWTANAVSTSAATMVTLTQAAVTWAGQAPTISYIQRITAAAVSWVWRGVTGASGGGGVLAGLLSGVLRGVIRRRDPRDPDPPL